MKTTACGHRGGIPRNRIGKRSSVANHAHISCDLNAIRRRLT